MTKQELRSYTKIEKEVQQIEGMMRELNARVYSPRVPVLTGMPGAPASSPGSAQEKIATEIMEIRERYERRVAELYAERRRIEDAIDGLDDPDQRMILRYHYIKGYSWKKTAQVSHIDESTVYRKHGRALQILKDASLCEY